jgi:LEA14-like dessication related protein
MDAAEVRAVVTRAARRSAALATLLLAGGCALVAPHLERPQLSVVGIEVQGGRLTEQRFLVHLRVVNPNDRALPVRAIRCTLELGGEHFGDGMSGGAFSVPPRGEATFDMTVTTDLATALLKILPRLKDASHPLDYRITGRVETDLAFLTSLPFDERGTLH